MGTMGPLVPNAKNDKKGGPPPLVIDGEDQGEDDDGSGKQSLAWVIAITCQKW